MIVKKESPTPVWIYIAYLFSIIALLFSIKFPGGLYLGEIVLGFFGMALNKYVVVAVFLLSYYIALKNKQKVRKKTFQIYIVTVTTLIVISVISALF